MSRRFVDRVAVVTGAGSGIGRACAMGLAAEGAAVVVLDLDADAASSVAAEITAATGADRAVAVAGDVAMEADWERVRSVALDRYGRLDVLHSNAYRGAAGGPEDVTYDAFRGVLDVNVGGLFLGARVLADALRTAGGAIVVTSSVHAHTGLPDYTAYAASKGAITALTRQLAVQLAPRIRVNAVVPGPIRTPSLTGSPEEMARTARATVLGRVGEPDEVARAVLFLAADESSFITGSAITVDGGWSITKDSL